MVLTPLNGKDLMKGVGLLTSCKGFMERDTYLEVKDLKAGLYYLFVEMDYDETSPGGSGNAISVTCYG